jgi:competence protein ComGF
MPANTPKTLPNSFLGQVLANERIKRFQEGKLKLLSNDLQKEDTKSVWFSFESIEGIYKELVYLNANGLRVYFGTYENELTAGNAQGQLTVIFVATALNANNLNEDIILETLPDFAERQTATKAAVEAKKAVEQLGIKKEFDFGSPCPPDCGEPDPSKFPQP